MKCGLCGSLQLKYLCLLGDFFDQTSGVSPGYSFEPKAVGLARVGVAVFSGLRMPWNA